MKVYYILVNETGVFVKAQSYFLEQKGDTLPWGKNWESIAAKDLDDARQIAIKLRRQRFPDSHKTIGEE